MCLYLYCHHNFSVLETAGRSSWLVLRKHRLSYKNIHTRLNGFSPSIPHVSLTGGLGQTVPYCDGEGLPSRFELGQVSLPPLKHHHPGASSSPALFLHSELQPDGGGGKSVRLSVVCMCDFRCKSVRESARLPLPVSEGDCQFSLGHVLVAFQEQAEELRLEVGLQQTVVLGLVEDEEVILSCTKGK